ncbi:MAG: hypothetical protein MZV63_35420 [Marinilabiliales bacterium]|nr:hypothetical protein [Marinilabiliales bacterium]
MGSKTGNIAAGFNFSNIGSKMSYTTDVDPDFIPMNMRLGTTFSVQPRQVQFNCLLLRPEQTACTYSSDL